MFYIILCNSNIINDKVVKPINKMTETEGNSQGLVRDIEIIDQQSGQKTI